jgi:hypothetical protein
LLARIVTEFRYRVIRNLEFISVIAKVLNNKALVPIRASLKILRNSTTPRTLEYQPATAISHVVNHPYQEFEASCRNYGFWWARLPRGTLLNRVHKSARMRCVSHMCACGDPWSLTAVLSLFSLRWPFVLIHRWIYLVADKYSI